MTNHYEAFVLLELEVCLRLFLVCLGGGIAACRIVIFLLKILPKNSVKIWTENFGFWNVAFCRLESLFDGCF